MKKEWLDKFWELYDSSLHSNFSKALELKRNNIPKFLYRYRSLENMKYRLDEIRTGEIWIAAPSEFNEVNDIFDAGSILYSNKAEKYMGKDDKRLLYEKQFEQIEKEKFEQIFSGDNWYNKLIDFVVRDEKQKGNIDITLEEMKEKLNEAVMSQLELLNDTINKLSNLMNRIACLTIKNDNLPMWTHYANNHKGICIEYDTTTIKNILVLDSLFPVKYKEEFLDGIAYMMKYEKDKTKMFHFFDRLAVQKLIDWEYEQEWRLILNMGHLYYSPDEIPSECKEKGQLYYFTKPSKVIMGCKIEAENEKEIRAICEKENIQVAKMRVTPYGLMCD